MWSVLSQDSGRTRGPVDFTNYSPRLGLFGSSCMVWCLSFYGLVHKTFFFLSMHRKGFCVFVWYVAALYSPLLNPFFEITFPFTLSTKHCWWGFEPEALEDRSWLQRNCFSCKVRFNQCFFSRYGWNALFSHISMCSHLPEIGHSGGASTRDVACLASTLSTVRL
jgi:hypothetical protein